MASDVSAWLVSDENPVRETDRLDYERCAALHNHLVERGWLGSGRTLSDLDRRSWTTVHGDDSEEARERLSPSLLEFLDRAYNVSDKLRFFYWVENLNEPDALWENHEDGNDDEDEYRYLTLYSLNENLADQGDGLIYDQTTNRAIMQMDILDEEITRREDEPPLWHPLETVLTSWIRMIDSLKITPSLKSTKADNEKYEPWSNHRYSQPEVEEAVKAFQDLTDAIHSRMESSTESVQDLPPLLDPQILSDAGVPTDSFAHAFCSRARRPPFKFIAPGLQIPQDSTFSSGQTFVSIVPPTDTGSYLLVPPILLFRAADKAEYTISDSERPFDYVYHDVKTMPAGLYIPDTNRRSPYVSEASGRLVLPFAIGEDQFVRKSDNTKFHNGTSLYELGYPPFGGGGFRPQRLVKILQNWITMVENGSWEVSDEGVMGGVEKFQEADTDEWSKYWISPTW